MIIKKYETQEEEQLKALINLCSEDGDLLNIMSGTVLKFAYSAIFDNKLIGTAFAWTSTFHPNCTYFRILAHPFYSSFNVEEKLLSKVIEQTPEDLPLQTSLWETALKLNSVYKNNGFKEIRRTYMPSLKLSVISKDISFDENKYQIKTLDNTLMNGTITEQLILLVKKIYEETHEVNTVADIPVNKWRELTLSEDLIRGGSFVYLDKDEKNILAYSFLHQSDEKDSVELGWCGASTAEHIQLVPQLVLHQIEYAIQHDIQLMIGEFDTTDKYAIKVLGSFPFVPSPAWITYQKR